MGLKNLTFIRSEANELFSMSNLEKVREAIEEYNKYRVPEVKAELVVINNKTLKVRFCGDFRCCIIEWFEDLKYELQDFGINAKISRISEESPCVYLVEYEIESNRGKSEER